MFVVIDIILAAVILICAVVGYKKGFINTVLRLLSGIIAFLCAFFLTPVAAPYVNEKIFFPGISERAQSILSGVDTKQLFSPGRSNEELRSFLEMFGADYEDIRQTFAEQASKGADNVIKGITERVVSPVSYAISYALTFLVIFAAALLLLFILRHILGAAAKLPVIKTANKGLGLIVGAVLGVLIVWVLAVVIKMQLPYLQVMAPEIFPPDLFDRSIVLKIMYHLNALKGMADMSHIRSLLGY